MRITISKDFTDAPGGRYIKNGDFSGEYFREKHLVPAFDRLSKGEKLIVNLDGCFGFVTSFLEEAFGGLAREKGTNVVLERIEIEDTEQPERIELIKSYIKNANNK